MNTELVSYQQEVKEELNELLNWWIKFTIDKENGGFYGKVDNDNVATKGAIKGLVLNARVLYTFSSAYLLYPIPAYLNTANRAFEYLISYFLDQKHGGFYWSVNHKGEMLDSKKQVYGQSFVLYALAEYYKITQREDILSIAKQTFLLLEQHSYDPIHHGYIEAHTRDWSTIDDLRLSDKDQNEKKSMNTHLHIIEAYTNLFSIWKDENLKKAIKQLLANFKQHIIHPNSKHLTLFFTDDWQPKSTTISFGHDIEAAWLLFESATIIKDKEEINAFKKIALQLTTTASKGLNKEGALWYEYESINKHWTKEIHWWPQAEAMVGFFNTWQINHDPQQLANSMNSWNFIKQNLKDTKNGEWFWGINIDGTIMQNEDKAGFWKCPYHNGRACIEIIKRIFRITNPIDTRL